PTGSAGVFFARPGGIAMDRTPGAARSEDPDAAQSRYTPSRGMTAEGCTEPVAAAFPDQGDPDGVDERGERMFLHMFGVAALGKPVLALGIIEIGRASCRERV